MPADLCYHLQLARNVHCGSDGELAQSVQNLLNLHGEIETREVLRILHLYFGFPRLVHAWNVALPALEQAAGTTPSLEPKDKAEPNPDLGLQTFQFLYGEKSERVLQHLHRLDPLLRQWILTHAYGAVISRPGLSLATKERISILCLAATGCWQQWQSHIGIALRHGVASKTLLSDLHAVDWLDSATRTRAEFELKLQQKP
jgi:alkylhydroperoxidase/carboxymuconolactone decarboxylase family protein YurZ